MSYLKDCVVFLFHSIWDIWQKLSFTKAPEGEHLKQLTNLHLISLHIAFERVKDVVWKCFTKQKVRIF